MSAEIPSIRFQRPNYLVTDMDQALRVYVGILGLELAFTKESAKDSYSYEVFQIPVDANMRFAVLSAPGQRAVMALTEIDTPMAPVPLPSRAAIVFEIQNFDEVKQKAIDEGLTVFNEGSLLTNDGRTGRELGILDHDGNLIVIYKILTHPED